MKQKMKGEVFYFGKSVKKKKPAGFMEKKKEKSNLELQPCVTLYGHPSILVFFQTLFVSFEHIFLLKQKLQLR